MRRRVEARPAAGTERAPSPARAPPYPLPRGAAATRPRDPRVPEGGRDRRRRCGVTAEKEAPGRSGSAREAPRPTRPAPRRAPARLSDVRDRWLASEGGASARGWFAQWRSGGHGSGRAAGTREGGRWGGRGESGRGAEGARASRRVASGDCGFARAGDWRLEAGREERSRERGRGGSTSVTTAK